MQLANSWIRRVSGVRVWFQEERADLLHEIKSASSFLSLVYSLKITCNIFLPYSFFYSIPHRSLMLLYPSKFMYFLSLRKERKKGGSEG